jgi:hypothetical protein
VDSWYRKFRGVESKNVKVYEEARNNLHYTGNKLDVKNEIHKIVASNIPSTAQSKSNHPLQIFRKLDITIHQISTHSLQFLQVPKNSMMQHVLRQLVCLQEPFLLDSELAEL